MVPDDEFAIDERAHETSALRVLVVDDHRESRSVVSKYITYKGIEVVEAGNARDALLRLRDDGPFAVLLTDMLLPDLDGRELVLEAKKISPTLWCALITGWSVAPEELLPWRIDRLFIKPVNLAELCRALLDVFGGT